MDEELIIRIPVDEDDAITSLDALQRAFWTLLSHVHISWSDRDIMNVFLKSLRETSPKPDALHMQAVFGEHVLQRELVLFRDEDSEAFTDFALEAQENDDVANFVVLNWDFSDTVVETVELPLFSEEFDVMHRRVYNAARFLKRFDMARGEVHEIADLLTLMQVELITIMPM